MTFRARLWAAVLATDGLLAFGTAGRLWGVTENRDDDTVHVIVDHPKRVVLAPGVRLHRCGPSSGATTRTQLPVTGRTQTVLDLVATLPRPKAVALADRAVQRGWLVPDDVDRRLRTQPKRPGNAQLRHIRTLLCDGAAAESERVLHRLLRTAGIRNWTANHPVWVAGELIAVVDVALVARRIAIEVDGMAFHVDVDRFGRDRTRQNALIADGWTVLRFTWADLTERPGYVLATIRRFL